MSLQVGNFCRILAISWYPSDIFSIILSPLVDVSVMYPVELSLNVRSQVPIQTYNQISQRSWNKVSNFFSSHCIVRLIFLPPSHYHVISEWYWWFVWFLSLFHLLSDIRTGRYFLLPVGGVIALFPNFINFASDYRD